MPYRVLVPFASLEVVTHAPSSPPPPPPALFVVVVGVFSLVTDDARPTFTNKQKTIERF